MSALRAACCLLLASAAACADSAPDDSRFSRGRGLKPAPVSVEGEAAIIQAAARATFDASPDLTLRLHPQRLPRTPGWTDGDGVPAALVAALRDRGVVTDVCVPERDGPRNTPRCTGGVAGYIIRASEVLRVATDTVQIHFAAEAFGPATGQRPPALRMEKIYQLVGAGSTWRVVREARAKVD